MSQNSADLLETARGVVALAKKKGAQGVAANAYRVRDVDVEWRDGRLEKITEATTRGVAVSLYVDGRYATMNTSDLRPDALEGFLAQSVALTRALEADPFRLLPEPAWYAGQSTIDLQLDDPAYSSMTPQARRQRAEEMEVAARSAKGADAILSVTTSFGDRLAESARVHSNGFEGTRRETLFGGGADVSVKDADGRRPEDGWSVNQRHLSGVPSSAEIGARGANRAISCLGSQKAASGQLTMVLENRAAGSLLGRLLSSLSASSLQQKRSFLEGKVGTSIGSSLLTVIDDPLVPQGLGSRLYDTEGLAAKQVPLFDGGVLRNFYVDTYYGRKLKLAPTTGSASNLTMKLGSKNHEALLADVKDGIFVTGFLGGNSNSTTGDFSLGVKGFRIRQGALAEPVSEMNIADNHLALWQKLVAVGNDPYLYAAARLPTLVFDTVMFAGV